jgi:hypothetical protein
LQRKAGASPLFFRVRRAICDNSPMRFVTLISVLLASASVFAQTLPDAVLAEPKPASPTIERETKPQAQANDAPRLNSERAVPASIDAPSATQFSRLCEKTADPAECGKRIETRQMSNAVSSQLVKRDGKLLAVTIPGEPPFIFEDIDSEAGPNVSFYAYSSGADAVVLYRARADKVDFLLLHRPTGNVTELPNEPKFNRDGRFFATIDFCKDGCENRLAVWRVERRGAMRERVFSPRTPWDDADVSWGGPTRLVLDVTEGGKSSAINLDVNDSRWTVLLP